jgi:thiol-disulfide isomerase/thioredoxin
MSHIKISLRSPSNAPNRPRIRGNHQISCHQDNSVNHHLGDQNPVEFIFVHAWQQVDCDNLFAWERSHSDTLESEIASMIPAFRRKCLSVIAGLLAIVPSLLSPVLGSVLAAAQEAFHVNKDLYSEAADPAADIAAARLVARREHKRILLDFGGNWCGDCQLLDYYYHQSPNAELLAKYYIVVHIDIGHMDHNVAIARKYRVPITKGVPALAVLDAQGDLLYAEHEKEFEHTSVESVTLFLRRWKG